MLIGKKIGMTRLFDEEGIDYPVTMIEAGPCIVTQLKTVENDGYSAMQIGFDNLADNKISKPVKGHFSISRSNAKKHIKEFPLNEIGKVSYKKLENYL